ncbi:MAG: FeoB-associated Cys-rich membrane protein [Clostridia bacterium]|nr:FeoB-associated Cys-rich membrane protein [Clostridia bacterium]
MINWVVGGIIVGLTIFVIVRTILRMRRGESTCCSGCSKSQCNCEHKS